ncbi:hypothetical protein Celaphus_00011184 [Cervus elaphus hippelaphus]|uniref:Uncharacterized protein n=1 Tax=Cervus elaphus hippelaphus TaxID=46360 RepID=A0A212CR79_CEREH|nr:hypothetical protein Celaphus_00011184 [Cervus elaphus hippelaphus]
MRNNASSKVARCFPECGAQDSSGIQGLRSHLRTPPHHSANAFHDSADITALSSSLKRLHRRVVATRLAKGVTERRPSLSQPPPRRPAEAAPGRAGSARARLLTVYRVRRVFLEVTLSLQVAANLQLYTSHALCGLESDFLAAEKQTVSAERPHRPPRVMGCLRLIRWRRWDFTAEGESSPSTSGAVLKLTPTVSVVYQNAFFKGITTGYFQSTVLPKRQLQGAQQFHSSLGEIASGLGQSSLALRRIACQPPLSCLC